MPNASSTQQGKDESNTPPTNMQGDRENSSSRTSNSTAGGMEPVVPAALICDNSLVRSGLQRVMAGTPFVVTEEKPTTDLKTPSEEAQEPALCILVAHHLSSHTSEMVRQVKDRHPNARIVVLADHLDLGFVTQAREIGVDGFCLTASSPEVLITSLELVMLGELVLPGVLVRSILAGDTLSPEPNPEESKVRGNLRASDPGARSLSAREAEILRCLMDGAPNKIIARKLDVAEATVKVHVKAILRKIGATNRTQAALWAMDHLPMSEEASQHG